MSVLIDNRINSCLGFYHGKCSHQITIHRVYLVPQILSVVQKKEYERTCFDCDQYVNRLIHLIEAPPDAFIPEVKPDLQ